MKKSCMNCEHWRIGVSTNEDALIFGNCIKMKTGTDVRIVGRYLQTSSSFWCKYFKAKSTQKNVEDDKSDSNNDNN